MDVSMTKCFVFHQEMLKGILRFAKPVTNIQKYECQWKLLTEQFSFLVGNMLINTCTDLLEMHKAEWGKQSKF